MLEPQFGSLAYIRKASEDYDCIIDVSSKRDDAYSELLLTIKPDWDKDELFEFVDNHVPLGLKVMVSVKKD